MTWSFLDIIIWIFVFVVGSLIVTFLLSPNSFQALENNIKDIIPSSVGSYDINKNVLIQLNETKQNEIKQNEIEQINSTKECSKILKEKIKILETKSFFDLDSTIIESEWFNNTPEALNYLEKWGYYNPDGYNPLRILDGLQVQEKNFKYVNVEQNDIVITLVRFDSQINGMKFKPVYPIVCIDGEFTNSSNKLLSGTGL